MIDMEKVGTIADLNRIKEWICVIEWVQATPSDGAWWWRMYCIENDKLNDEPLASGIAFWKLGVYFKVARECRKHGLRFRPNVRGKIPS